MNNEINLKADDTIEDAKDAADRLRLALNYMIGSKSNDRTPRDRHIAIAITDLEKIIAYWQYYIIEENTVDD